MPRLATALFAASSLVGTALAHGYVQELWVGNTWYPGSNWDQYVEGSPVRPAMKDGAYVHAWDVNTEWIACGYNGRNPVPFSAPIIAGESVKVRWHGDRGWPGTAQDWWGHYEGPIIDYLMRCDGKCQDWYADRGDARVFKIQESGLDTSQGRQAQNYWPSQPSGNGLWAQDKMARIQQSWWEIPIPSDIAAGSYILRHELLAIHDNQSGGQSYPVCIQLDIYGGNNVYPPETNVRQIYQSNDMWVNIYEGNGGISSYTIPGPAIHRPAARKRMEKYSKRAEQLSHHAA